MEELLIPNNHTLYNPLRDQSVTIIPLPYKLTLRDYQIPVWNAFFNKGIKNIFLDWHRRCGKEITYFTMVIAAMLQRRGNYHYVFPKLKQAKNAIFMGITKGGMPYIDFIPPQFLKRVNKTDNYIELTNGSILHLCDSDNYDKYRGMSSNGVILSEVAFQNPKSMKVFLAMIAETEGFLFVNTTPDGHNHAWRMLQNARNDPEWFVSTLTLTDTKIISDQEIKRMLVTDTTKEEILQEFFCDWDVALASSYFASYIVRAESDNRILDFPIDTSMPVHTFWDIGTGLTKNADMTSICFVQIGNDGYIRFIGYYEQNMVGVNDHVNFLNDFRNKHGITYGTHFLPHDGKNGEFCGFTRKSQLEELMGYNVMTVERPDKKIDKINATRLHFSKYKIHATNCEFLLDCLRSYKRKVLNSGQDVGPDHDWTSHAADAFMLVALADKQELLRDAGYGFIVENEASNEYLL